MASDTPMDFGCTAVFLFLSILDMFTLAQTVPDLKNSTDNTTSLAHKTEGDAEDEQMKVRAALIIGIGLSVLIIGCITFFLSRSWIQQSRYQNHRQMRKLRHQNGTNGRYTENEECQTFTEIKL